MESAWELVPSCSSVRPFAKYNLPSRKCETCGRALGCCLHANQFSSSEHPQWRGLSSRRKKFPELDVGFQRRMGCGEDKCSSGAEVTSDAHRFPSKILGVFPEENHGNLEPKTTVFSGFHKCL